MTKKIKGSANFECNNCHYRHTVVAKDLDFKAVEWLAGTGVQYTSNITINCKSCGQTIILHFEVNENSAEVIGEIIHSESGAKNVRCKFKTIDSADDSPDHQNRLIGSAAGGAILGASLGGPIGALLGGALGVLLGDSVNNAKKKRG